MRSLHEKATGEARKFVDAKVKQFTTVGPFSGRHQGKRMSLRQAKRAALEIARRRNIKGAPPPKAATEAITMSLADRILGESKGPRYKSLKNESASLHDRILGEGKKAAKAWGHSDFQTKIKSKKPWGASTFQTKVHTEGQDDLFSLVDSLVELRNSIIQK